MDYIPKRNLLADHQERNLAFLMADRDPAKYHENLYKLRAIANSPQKEPLTKKQENTLARGMAGGTTASRADIADKKAEIRTILGRQGPATKRDLLKEQALKKEAPAKSAQEKEKGVYQPKGPIMPDKVTLPSGKTFQRDPNFTKKPPVPQKPQLSSPPKTELPQTAKLGDRTFQRPATHTKQESQPGAPKRDLLQDRKTKPELPAAPSPSKTPPSPKERKRTR